LIAIGGVSRDSYHDLQKKAGRLCRFYLYPDYHSNKLGFYLFEYIEQYEKTYFCELHFLVI